MTNKNDSNTTNTSTTTPDNPIEDLYDLPLNAPDNYILRQTFEPEYEQETRNQHPTSPYTQETQTEHTNTKSTSTTQTDDESMSGLTKTLFSASPGNKILLDNDVFNHLTTDEGNNIMYSNLSTNPTLKKKRHMYYFPMDFEKLTLDGLIDTCGITSAISEADLNKIKLLSNEAIKDTGPAPNFQMKTPPNPLIGLCFLQRHNALLVIRQGIITFPYLSMQLRPEHTTNIRAATPLLTETTYTLQPGETLAISSEMPHLLDHNATGMVTPSPHMEDHESIFITSSLSTVNNNAVGYQVNNFSDRTPFQWTHTWQISEYSPQNKSNTSNPLIHQPSPL